MNIKQMKYEIGERISKDGNTYKVLVLYITETFTKEVFVSAAELELLKMNQEESYPQVFR